MSEHVKFQPITLDDSWFVGAMAIFRFTIWDENDVQEDPTTWALSWILRKNRSAPDFELNLTDPPDIAVVSQKALVTVTADMTEGFEASTYYHYLWRTDPGFETVLAHGPAELQK